MIAHATDLSLIHICIVNIVGYLGCEHLNLIVSNYFVAMERAKLVPYMIDVYKRQG